MTTVTMTEEEYRDHRENYMGVCLNCRAYGLPEVEPDAREYECPECGDMTVYGAEEALLMGRLKITEG